MIGSSPMRSTSLISKNPAQWPGFSVPGLFFGASGTAIFISFVILVIFIALRRVPLYVFAWPIAIAMDVLTHRREFLPTPFLWPVSEWRFPGISWGTRWFLALNYAAIAVSLAAIIILKRRRRRREGSAR